MNLGVRIAGHACPRCSGRPAVAAEGVGSRRRLEGSIVKHRIVFNNLPFLLPVLALAPTALASSTWYVDGVNGSDNNNCKSPQTACKTIGHAISLASSGDSIMVAAATYRENLTIGISLKVIGSGARQRLLMAEVHGTVVRCSNTNAHVTLSKLTIRNGLVAASTTRDADDNNSTISGNCAGTGLQRWQGDVITAGQPQRLRRGHPQRWH